MFMHVKSITINCKICITTLDLDQIKVQSGTPVTSHTYKMNAILTSHEISPIALEDKNGDFFFLNRTTTEHSLLTRN